VEQVVAADDFRFRVREEREGEGVAVVLAGVFRGVDADGERLDADGFELGEALLDTP
jgi:hypothetical protein